MSTTTPFIGSKISLISKAEIRYEGILYFVDTVKSTVTLAKVRSFGTENRPSPEVFPPMSKVYDLIIFRGSDIKDLNVSEMPEQHTGSISPPQDPAILSAQSAVSSSVPSTITGPSQPPPMQTRPPHVHGLPPPPHPYFQQHPPHGYSAYRVPYFRPPVLMGTGGTIHYPRPILPTQLTQPVVHATSATQGLPSSLVPQQGSFMGALPAEVITPPRSLVDITAPSSTLVATPTSLPESVVKPQASSTPLAEDTSSTPPQIVPALAAPAQPIQVLDQEPPLNPTTTIPQSHPLSAQPSRRSPSPPPSQLENNGVREGRRGGGGRRGRRGQEGNGRREENTRRQPARSHDPPQSDGNGLANHYGNSNWTSQGYQRGRREGSNYHRGGRGRGRGGGGGWRGDRGHLRQNSDHRSGGHDNTAKTAFKYESEFDFESANARFKKEDLELEFKQKLKIDDGTRKLSEGSQHGLEGVSSDEEVLIVEGGEVPPEKEEEEFYDKSKSFFDNISCEGAPGTNRRPSRNEEREVNTETFGVNSVAKNYCYYHYRQNWRGRGRGGNFRGRGRYGGGNRGGYSGNLRNRHHDYAPKAETNSA